MDAVTRLERRGVELFTSGRPGEALSCLDAALRRWPELPRLWNNRGVVLISLGRFAEAGKAFRRALALAPALHESRVALATCLQALGDIDQAISCCETVLAACPGHPKAHWNLALLLLITGDYRRGWQEYEWRWKTASGPFVRRNYAGEAWQGESLSGRRILVHAEQGLGDTIQFCRFLPDLVDRGAQVIFACHRSLHRLMGGLGMELELAPPEGPPPAFDCHLPLLSLPLLLEAWNGPPSGSSPYLTVPGQPPAPRPQPPLKVGLCWSGNRLPDPRRSCPARLLRQLASVPGVEFHTLQVGGDAPASPFPLIDRTASLGDFADTAVLLSELDLVISIDTAVAHLAGALGKSCWVMLPFAPDWRWGRATDGTPWYPTARLFRQPEPGAWPPVVAAVREALATLAR